MKKNNLIVGILFRAVIFLIIFMLCMKTDSMVYADNLTPERELYSGDTENDGGDDADDDIWETEIYDELFDDIETVTDEYAGMSFKEVFSYIKTGDIEGLIICILSGMKESITHEIKSNNKYILQLLAVIILGSVFTGLTGKFGKMVSGNGFFVTYLVASGILLGIFSIVNEIAAETVGNISDIMLTFIPAYTLAVSYTNGTGTAEFAYEATIFIIYLCENVICAVVFPITKCSVVIGLVNRMNEEDYFSKTVDLLGNIASWIIKSMLAFITGFNIIKGIITPTIDKLSRNAVLKTFSMLPGGGTVKNISDIIIGSGLLLKNAVGMAGAVMIIAVSLIPVVKIAVIYLMLRVLAAISQPLGDRRFSDGVNAVAKGSGLVLKGMWCAALMFSISLVVMTLLAGG